MKTRIKQNMVRKKHEIFMQLCQSFSTNSELLPASAYNFSMRAVVRRSTSTRSAAIFLRLKARDCLFLGAICWREQAECYYIYRDNVKCKRICFLLMKVWGVKNTHRKFHPDYLAQLPSVTNSHDPSVTRSHDPSVTRGHEITVTNSHEPTVTKQLPKGHEPHVDIAL
jgi:hypothetical protein